MQLRPYQSEIAEKTIQSLDSNQKPLIQLPTGGGKTIIFTSIANHYIEKGHPVLVLAHREELIKQAASKLEAVTRQPVGIVKSGISPDYDAPIQVASVQSAVSRLDKMPTPALIITDEAHHITPTYDAVYDHFSGARKMGVTATPIRKDGKGLGAVYSDLIQGPRVRELINAGFLCDYRFFASPTQFQRGQRKRGGDYSLAELERKNNIIELSGGIIDSYQQFASGKRCLVFAINCEHARNIAQKFNKSGIPAADLNGETDPEVREETLNRFREGEIKVIVNCELFTEGVDIPSLEAVQIARPTASLGLWLQMLGRALRPAEGKENAIFIDHTDNWDRLRLPCYEHRWTLEGVKKRSKKGEREMIVSPEGEVTEKDIIVENDGFKLTEIKPESVPISSAIPEDWMSFWEDLINTQRGNKYHPYWIKDQLAEHNPVPPLKLWQAFAEYAGKKRGWGFFLWKEATENSRSREYFKPRQKPPGKAVPIIQGRPALPDGWQQMELPF